MAFSSVLERLMAERGMKAIELSRASGVTTSYISKILTGTMKEPTWSKACALIDALGVSLDEFHALEDDDGAHVEFRPTIDEKRLLEDYRRLDTASQESCRAMVGGLMEAQARRDAGSSGQSEAAA